MDKIVNKTVNMDEAMNETVNGIVNSTSTIQNIIAYFKNIKPFSFNKHKPKETLKDVATYIYIHIRKGYGIKINRTHKNEIHQLSFYNNYMNNDDICNIITKYKGLTYINLTNSKVSKMENIFINIDNIISSLVFNNCVIIDDIYNKIVSDKLTYIQLDDCNISSLKFIENLPNLTNINLSNNFITDNELIYLRNITKSGKEIHINLSNNCIFDYSMLISESMNICSLTLSNNRIKSIPYCNNYSICSLNLSYNEITEIDNLIRCNSLRNIDLSYNKITNIDIFNNIIFNKISSYYFNNNDISNIIGLSSVVKISKLDLSNNSKLSSLSFLHNKCKNCRIDIRVTNITKIDFYMINKNDTEVIIEYEKIYHFIPYYIINHEIFNIYNNITDLSSIVIQNMINYINMIISDLEINGHIPNISFQCDVGFINKCDDKKQHFENIKKRGIKNNVIRRVQQNIIPPRIFVPGENNITHNDIENYKKITDSISMIFVR